MHPANPDAIYSSALALPAESRAVLADLLLESLCEDREGDRLEPAERWRYCASPEFRQKLSAHFHAAKRAALQHAGSTGSVNAASSAS